MPSPSRVVATLAAVLAMGVGGGCGSSLYDAKGVPILVPVCTGDTPLYCASVNACFAEDTTRCGPACNACPPVANGNAFCDKSSPELSLHACAFQCNASFVLVGSACECPVGTNVCGQEVACSAQGPARCGTGCVACQAPANASPTCTNGVCGFACNPGFVSDGAGGCVCPGGTNACGGALVCAAETAAACGPGCVACAPPAAHGAAVCSAGACGIACDGSFVRSGSACVCPASTNVCGAETACHPEGPLRCGAGCVACGAPANGNATCTAGACGIACDATFQPDGLGGCVCPTGTPALCNLAGVNACLAQDTRHCGPSCQACTAAPVNAAPICDTVAQQCSFACAIGFRKDPNGPGCICEVGTNLCAPATTCQPMTDNSCGPTCTVCPAAPAHALTAQQRCDVALGTCGFTCGAGFVKSPAGDACVCASPGEVTCGGGVGGTCVAEGITAACGPTCATCTAPAGPWGTATASCTGHQCDYTCPANQPVKCTTAGLPDCCPNTAGCAADQVACGTGPPPACVTENADQCGNGVSPANVCIVCPAAPAGAARVCNAATGHLCDFTCPTGTFKNKAAGACETVGAGASDVALGGKHSCAVTEPSRTVVCWGANDQGQLGDGTTTDRTAPVRVLLPAGATVKALGAGQAHTCAVRSDAGHAGEVWCWGANTSGQLAATASATPTTAPVRAGTATASTTAPAPLALGASHTCAINGSGGVACWGANTVGQLGDGTGVSNPAPQPTGITSGVTWIASSFDTTCAVAGGAVRCWGADDRGQVGNGAQLAVGVLSPAAAVPGTGPVTAVAVGQAHACGIGPAPSVPFCWGDNSALQLGNRLINRSNPPGTISLAAVNTDELIGKQGGDFLSAGAHHTCTGKVLDTAPGCAGDAGTGAVPLPPQTGQSPATVGGVPGAMQRVFSGASHNCSAMLPTLPVGAPLQLWCWGFNDRGQLGNGATATAPTPSPVPPNPQ